MPSAASRPHKVSTARRHPFARRLCELGAQLAEQPAEGVLAVVVPTGRYCVSFQRLTPRSWPLCANTHQRPHSSRWNGGVRHRDPAAIGAADMRQRDAAADRLRAQELRQRRMRPRRARWNTRKPSPSWKATPNPSGAAGLAGTTDQAAEAEAQIGRDIGAHAEQLAHD